MVFSIFVSCPKGLEYLLETELKTLGLVPTRVSPQGVYAQADLRMVYRICLWSRLAGRVQIILMQGHAADERALYDTCRGFAWDKVFSLHQTFAIVFHGTSDVFRHTLFGAQVIKDAIVDTFREKTAERPIVSREAPDILFHAYLKHDEITVSLDLTGYSLHQRGYRLSTGAAPLKEHVAAAMLMRAHWQTLAEEGYALQDVCCGAGTLVIEAAMMAANVAPGLLRHDQAFVHWLGHDEQLWGSLKDDARQQIKTPDCLLMGSDEDPALIDCAKENAQRAGVASFIRWDIQSLEEARPVSKQGLMITNPPYGVRMGEEDDLIALYRSLGETLHRHFQGWQAALLTASPLLAKALGLRSHKQYTLYNGPLVCKLYCITLDASNQLKTSAQPVLSDGAQMFANRLEKNLQHLGKWAKREGISCYRVYDADLPDYAFAIDRYTDHVVLQEYAAPRSMDEETVATRRMEVIQAVPRLLGVPQDHVILKQRKQQKGLEQYEKQSDAQCQLIVTEGQAKFLVNLSDYLDTGLFLDHRLLRLRFANMPKATRFLNCFCYTGTASVHAALAGAMTTNVDLSNTYLTWAQENFRLNGLDVSRHQFIQYDCITWLAATKDTFDVIFLDPPSFSNSKRMQSILDIQRDHEALIASAKRLLNPGGILYFSTNLRQFKLAPHLLARDDVEDISIKTIDLDFKRNQRIHQCFKIQG
ncbi:MAG: bifunctional 23S rRNA (guanine(2069)-N(7))-methyltransferase RlmK/23S rRNA (guanine(2445)-N(2))-methyltransferase RlmL [Legionellaceae bacterium]